MTTSRAARNDEELSLLRAVAADRSDAANLSVYCDWLEDRGDVRGPFLREFLRAFDARDPLPPDPPGLPATWAEVLALPLRRLLRDPFGAAIEEERAEWAKQEYPTGFASLEPHFDLILASAAPCIHARVGAPLSDPPLGTTRAGGRPDLPVGLEWPILLDGPKPEPLSFVFQIDLADLRGTFADGLLPPAGLLSLFYNPSDGADERSVTYSPPGTRLRRNADPRWKDYVVGPCSLELSDAVRQGDRFRDFEGVDENLLDNLRSRWREYDYSEWNSNWLFTAWKKHVCWRFAEVPGSPEAWLELAELSDDHQVGWTFGDGDILHVFVPAADARRGLFSGALSLDAS